MNDYVIYELLEDVQGTWFVCPFCKEINTRRDLLRDEVKMKKLNLKHDLCSNTGKLIK